MPAFGTIEPERVLGQDDLFAVVRDKLPVSPGHMLIIPRRAVARFQDLNAAERTRLGAEGLVFLEPAKSFNAVWLQSRRDYRANAIVYTDVTK